MRSTLLSTAVVAALAVLYLPNGVCLPEPVEKRIQSPIHRPVYSWPPTFCVPYCSRGRRASPLTIAEQREADVELKKSPAMAKRVQAIKTQELKAQSVNSFAAKTWAPPQCPCKTPSRCLAESEKITRCGRCWVIWPFGGLITTKCANRYRTCNMRNGHCGCTGGCNEWGRKLRWVVLYCRGLRPTPIQIKRVPVCTSCCCLNNYGYNPYVKG